MKAFSITIAILIIAETAMAEQPEIVPPAIAERFQSLEWHSNSLPNQSLRYRLYTPERTETDQGPWPLLVWFHGQGEHGDDNLLQLRWMDLLFNACANSPPLFILAVQDPADQFWIATDATASESDMVSITNQILEQVLKQYPVDQNRIYVSGVSAGGTACWELACRHPERFAAIAPMATGGGDVPQAQNLVDTPIWVFHSRSDKIPIENVQAIFESVQSGGGSIKLTQTTQKTSSSHDCWTPAFEDYHLLDWLLAQRRGQPVVWLPDPLNVSQQAPAETSSPKSFKSNAFPWFLSLNVAVLVSLVIYSAFKRRHRATDIVSS